MMTDYQVVWNTSLSKLEDHVKELMKGGWEPLGGIQMYTFQELGRFGESRMFCQAMGK
jgi:hypothetical protein